MLRILRGGNCPRLYAWVLNPIPAIHVGERQKENTHAEEELAITTQAEMGVMRP